jgi:hypothetical protein
MSSTYGSPCRGRKHNCSWFHATLVNDYRAARHDQELAREQITRGYGTEEQQEQEDHSLITFKDWLTNYAQIQDQAC